MMYFESYHACPPSKNGWAKIKPLSFQNIAQVKPCDPFRKPITVIQPSAFAIR